MNVPVPPMNWPPVTEMLNRVAVAGAAEAANVSVM
jgi:hypothetical protein